MRYLLFILALIGAVVLSNCGGSGSGSDPNLLTVQIEVSAPGAEEIVIFADGNPNPNLATFKFGPAAGSQAATTRIRLAGEQDVIAIAKMSDGTFAKAVSNVKVTIGGCGG